MRAIERRIGERGMTMLEVSIMGVVMSLLLVMVSESIAGLSQTRAEQRQRAAIGQVGDRIARQIERDVAFAARVFSASPDGTAYLDSIEIGAALRTSGRRLPTMTSNGLFDRDPAGKAETGNIVLLASRRDRVSVEVEIDDETRTHCTQAYVFVVYSTKTLENGDLDVLRWVSRPLVNYWDAMEIGDERERTAVLARLYDAGIRYAWDPKAARESGLFLLEQAGALSAMPTSVLLAGAEDRQISDSLADRRMRVVPNEGITQLPVPEFATPFGEHPGGFEVKIDGSEQGKLVLLRLVVESLLPHRRRVFGELRRVVDTNG
jgi:type II secretory pathway pseudopilin PulG